MTFDGILYKATGGFVELDRAYEGFSAVTGAVLHEEHNKCPVLTLTLTSYADIEIDYRDSVQVGDRRYYALTHWSGYAARAAGRGEWEAKLYGAEQFMYKAVMYDTQEVEDTQEYTWQRQKNDIVQLGSLRTFGEWLCYNTNAVQGQRLFEYVHFTEAADEAEDFKVPAFNADNCLSCLYDVCELFGVDYEITEGVDAPFALRFVPARSVTLPGVYGTEVSDGVNELRSLSLRSADEEVYTQFEVTGGSDNLPLDYLHTELWLNENAYPLSSVYLPELYGRWGRSLKRINLPDVKPTFTGHVTAVDGTDRCRVQDIALAGKAQAWGLVGASLDVLTGGLMGYSFDIEHVDAAGWVTVREVSEAGTLTLPNGEHEAYQFKVGDTFTLTGLMLPDEYVTNAQARLLSEAQKQIEYYSAPRFECEITPSPGFVGVCGALMRIVHPPIGMDKEMVVRAIERDLRTGEVTRVTVGDFKTLTLGDSVVKRANRAKSEAVREAEAVTVASEAKQRAATASSVAQAREQMAAKLGFNSWQELADVAESAEGAPFNKIGDKWFLNADFVNALALVADEAFIANLMVERLLASQEEEHEDGTGYYETSAGPLGVYHTAGMRPNYAAWRVILNWAGLKFLKNTKTYNEDPITDSSDLETKFAIDFFDPSNVRLLGKADASELELTGHRLDGENHVLTLTDLPHNKRLVTVTRNTAASFSIAPGMKVGQELHIVLTSGTGFTQPIPDTGDYRCLGSNSLDMGPMEMAEINVVCISDTAPRYLITAQKLGSPS